VARKEPKELSGKQKAAVLLISLGPDVSASIYKHLSEEEIEKLTLEISSVKKVKSSIKLLSLRTILPKAGLDMLRQF
jgi:flagellar motor switch protein FliG